MSSGMLHNAHWYTVTDVSKDRTAFLLRVKRSITAGVTSYCLTEDEGTLRFQTVGNFTNRYGVTVTGSLVLQQYHCRNLRSRS